MISFHNLLSLHFSLQFLTFIFFKSSSAWSSHLSLALPTGLDEHGSHSVTFLTILVVSILTTCAAHRNLCDFINLTIFFFLTRISNSSFVFILHVPSLSNVGPYIFLSTLLSKTSRPFCSVTVIAHFSQPYVTVGRMIDLYKGVSKSFETSSIDHQPMAVRE